MNRRDGAGKPLVLGRHVHALNRIKENCVLTFHISTWPINHTHARKSKLSILFPVQLHHWILFQKHLNDGLLAATCNFIIRRYQVSHFRLILMRSYRSYSYKQAVDNQASLNWLLQNRKHPRQNSKAQVPRQKPLVAKAEKLATGESYGLCFWITYKQLISKLWESKQDQRGSLSLPTT